MKNSPTSTRQQTSNIAPFGLRMQPDLRAKLESKASENGRSLNAEIVARLSDSLKNLTGFSSTEIDEIAEKIAEKLAIKRK